MYRLFAILAALIPLSNWSDAKQYTDPITGETQEVYVWINNRDRNPTEGGLVSLGAYVDEHVFIAPTAKVLDSAYIDGSSIRIYGNAVVRGEASVSGTVRIFGNAVVAGSAVIEGDFGREAEIKIYGDAIVAGDTVVTSGASISGQAYLMEGEFADQRISPKEKSEARLQHEKSQRGIVDQQQELLKQQRALAAYNNALNQISKLDKEYDETEHKRSSKNKIKTFVRFRNSTKELILENSHKTYFEGDLVATSEFSLSLPLDFLKKTVSINDQSGIAFDMIEPGGQLTSRKSRVHFNKTEEHNDNRLIHYRTYDLPEDLLSDLLPPLRVIAEYNTTKWSREN
ncbi:MAG: hypothetical protein CML13_17535 [Puniceicoccaceae bacterium]|nr:hypothetical protein [Puniceicoccaceae bacterium]|tara:strand:+ start:495 stop:1520 length:1026 start_codon:yes stop_codon:yes gene_type:complete